MQHVLRVSRKIDYALRAMVHLASLAPGTVVPFRGIAREMDVPEDFLAKILKTLVDHGLVRSSRGPHGGYALGRPAAEISFLDVIEAAEGPVALNVCLDVDDACGRSATCTMVAVWREGQERMLDVYRSARLSELVPRALAQEALVRITSPAEPRPPGTP
jgi:Rrf2 family protein